MDEHRAEPPLGSWGWAVWGGPWAGGSLSPQAEDRFLSVSSLQPPFN